MSTLTLLVGMALAGQIAAEGDRYPFNAAAAAADGNLFDVLDEAAGDGPAAGTPAQGSDVPPGQSPLGDDSSPAAGVGESSAPGSDAQSPYGSAATEPLDAYPSGPTDSADAVAAELSPSPKPAALMRSMLTAPPESQLSGVPMSLAEVVTGALSRDDASQRIHAYWELCASVADYYLSLRQQEELRWWRQAVRQSEAEASRADAWQDADAVLARRVRTSRSAAVATQYRLISLTARGGMNRLPLPADAPHCGDYHTRYEEIFAGRPHAEAQELAALLPARYEELKETAAAVTRLEERLGEGASQAGITSDETEVLRALEILALQRRAFLQIARDYNCRIARYTELAAPGEIDPDRLVSMLISRRNSNHGAPDSSASSQPIDRQLQGASGNPPRTFVEGGGGWTPVGGERPGAATRDDAVQQAAGQSQPGARQERSLLVNPR